MKGIQFMNKSVNLYSNNKKTSIYFIGYLFFFYCTWTLKELWLIQYIYGFNDQIVPFFSAFFKITIWIIPVLVYIKGFLHEKPLDYMKLNINIFKGCSWGVFLSLLMGLRFIIEVYVVKQQTFNVFSNSNNYLNVFLIAGLTEEIVFRGFILNELTKRFTFLRANVITAFLFLIVHYPAWFYSGELFDLWYHFYIFSLGLLFGYIYKEVNSLWTVIILHSFHNLFVIIS
ncbi:type II CAAX endopeptidase family protein [Bacillus sp. TL12]|uniref:CPBP family intramembrane glutamic endopeptidase n=1 Tax=Bacillus sp. TL12 TaxID=2894756 RepID=UPI001F517A1F|nr:type II CAAX endopeptidase family protein [Bacillus sp. TL12]MCI0766701.1 CPBP family intramembrane metalloprotease [Bacillus sp. TL12]